MSSETDLRVKVGTEDQKFWEDLKKKIVDDNKSFRRNIEINEIILEFVERKIKAEKEKI